jgi:hypothetical protein
MRSRELRTASKPPPGLPVSIQIAVTDAHALIWYAMGRRTRLGPRARRVYEAAEAGRAAIYIPMIAILEVFEAARWGMTIAGVELIWYG